MAFPQLYYGVDECRSWAVVLVSTVVESPHDTGGHADSEMMCGNVSRDDTACTDHTSITNSDARKDGGITSNPAIIANFDVSGQTRRIVRRIRAFCGIQSVGYAVEMYVRPEKTSLADFYRG